MHYINLNKKTKKTVIQFAIYGLFAILIATLTVVLIYIVQGYDIDRKTGQVIQNGLILLDSAPDGASVTVNSVNEGKKTPTRLSVPENQYAVNLALDGYQDWNRNFTLSGSEVVWLDYPIFVPKDLRTIPINPMPKLRFAEISSNKKFMLSGQNNTTKDLTLYELGKGKNIVPQVITLPADVLTKPGGTIGTLDFIAWAPNDKHVLIKHTIGDTTEFVRFDVTKPDEAINISRRFSKDFDTMLFSKNADVLVGMRNGNVRIINLESATMSSPVARDIIEMNKAKDDEFYLVKKQTSAKLYELLQLIDQEIRLVLASQQNIRNIDYSEYDSAKYLSFIRGANEAVLYKDVQTENPAENVPLKVFNGTKMDEIAFSERGRFMMTRSGKNVHVYDIELKRDYSYGLTELPGPQGLSWIDEHHLSYVEAGRAFMMDFDGSNRYRLSKVDSRFPVIFSSERDRLFSIGTAKATQQPTLQRTELIITE